MVQLYDLLIQITAGQRPSSIRPIVSACSAYKRLGTMQWSTMKNCAF